MSEEALVEIRNVSRQYLLGKTVVKALEEVSLEIDRGGFLIVSGPSGSGKSTLLNLIGCIDQPTSGSVIFDGTDVASMPGERGLADDQRLMPGRALLRSRPL